MGARVLVLYNDDGVLAGGGGSERAAVEAVVGMAQAISAALQAKSWDARARPAPRDPARLAELLRTARTQLVFHCVESLDGQARFEAALAWVFELLHVPYTGSPPEAITLALDKLATKALLAARGIPVPAGVLLERGDESLSSLGPGPWFVKPVREDASHGISVDSLVSDEAAARAQARRVIQRYHQPALIEQYIAGREFNIAVLGSGEQARTLPLSEIDFSGLPAGHPPILTYEAKWDESSAVCLGSPPVPARALSAAQELNLSQVALAAYRTLGLRDYGRIDLRYDSQRGPFVLEANANPDLSPDAGLAKAARRAGLSYDELVDSIARAALARA